MKRNKENDQLIKQIIADSKNGYMKVLQSKYPDLISYILDITQFCDSPNRSFATRVWYAVNEINEYPTCKQCGKPITKNVYRRTDPRMDYCSQKCACTSNERLVKSQNSCLKTYGTTYPMKCKSVLNKAKKTNLERRGVEWVQQDRDVKAKSLETFNKHKESDSLFVPRITERIKNTTFKNNGFYYSLQTDKGKKAIRKNEKQTRIKASIAKKTNFYLNVLCNDSHVEPIFTLDEYLESKDKVFLWKCKKCGNVFICNQMSFMTPSNEKTYARCEKCYPNRTSASAEERNFKDWIVDNFGNDYDVYWNTHENYTVINPYQIDILIKVKNSKKILLGIEFDGSRWHSIEFGSKINRQLDKTTICEEKGISLIHVYEDEWLNTFKMKKIRKFIKAFLDGSMKKAFNDNVIKLSRDKFPKTFIPDNYQLVDESSPTIEKRFSLLNDIQYSVPNCGTLTYERICQ